MRRRYLLDTNVLSEPLRKSPDAGVMRCLEMHGDAVVTASPVWHEMVFGSSRLRPSRRRSAIERYLFEVVHRTVPVLPYDEAAAAWHAAERARLEASGHVPPFVDGQIAAVARTAGCVLVTADAAGFDQWEGLEIERWHSGPR